MESGSFIVDQNGNVAAITDYTASARQTRSMAYDGLDRLTTNGVRFIYRQRAVRSGPIGCPACGGRC